MWKKKTTELEQIKFKPPQQKVKYPKWTFCRVEETGKYYLLLENSKMEFISERAFQSWGKPYVLVSEKSISGYVKWKNIGFHQGTMIKSIADSNLWYITGSDPLDAERRLIATPDFFSVLGFDPRRAFVVSLDEVDFHKRGENISVIGL